ncbi:undecaprenyldiphospho-muramoylpentapeptide beta-N-acetylglucosaminyltransferase [Synechocystis sp. PCC 7509]|uniref:undecaprenyldiphospho-muramoylpentapeptide beta-N-acetylglucosaminyltransferase n=1 Tax=Synechocystis sp. PCC 7509 TaxID=927677 RepID=UPI0002AC0D12|nr:undecaprenyldiphospho-muramoylpentapeptide beta-N-acetylglucosaminyltransferase [Synechocystis sp. PCC 7509]
MVTPIRLLIAASGTGGHLFPAIAVAEQLSDYQIEWLGVPNRLETQLVPSQYPLNTVTIEGFQQKLGFGTFKILTRLVGSIFEVRKLLKQGNFQGVFTTGGYISAPAVIAARLLGIPVIFHESNALPGKVTRTFSRFCTVVAIGFESAAKRLPGVKTIYTGTPVRSQFRSQQLPLELPIPENVPLIVVFGGSQGAVAVNKLVRECVPVWCAAGAWVVHLTGDKDPDAGSLQHPQYLTLPFYDNMAALLNRASLAISRAGAASLTELAVTGTPAILIPYPYAAEDHQFFNAEVFTKAGATLVFNQAELTQPLLESKVMNLLNSPQQLQIMAEKSKSIAIVDSAERLAALVKEIIVKN